MRPPRKRLGREEKGTRDRTLEVWRGEEDEQRRLRGTASEGEKPAADDGMDTKKRPIQEARSWGCWMLLKTQSKRRELTIGFGKK